MKISRSFQRSRAVAAAAMLSVAALALSACNNDTPGPGENPGGGSGDSASFDPSSVTKDDALADKVPEAIKSKGKLTVGSDTSYAPAEFLADDARTPIGYDVDIAKAIGAKLGLEVEVQTAEFSGILPALGPKYDLGISSFTINEERLGAVNMVSYFKAGTAWAVKKGNPSNFNLDDVCGRNIGVQTGTVQEDPDLKERSAKCVADGKKPINVITLKLQTDVTTRLVNGSVDAMAADSPIIGYAISQTNGQLEKIGDTYDSAPQGVAVAKGDTAFAQSVTDALNALIKDGTYKKILDQWNTGEGAIEKSELNPTP